MMLIRLRIHFSSWFSFLLMTAFLLFPSVPSSAETLNFSYTSVGRLGEVSSQTSKLISYSYDNAGNLLTKTPGTDIAIAPPSMKMVISDNTVSLSWAPVANATGYELVFAAYPFTGPYSIGTIPLGNVNGLKLDLWPGAAFYVALKAYNAYGGSEYSNIESFVMP